MLVMPKSNCGGFGKVAQRWRGVAWTVILLTLWPNVACMYIFGPGPKARPAPNLQFPISDTSGAFAVTNAFPKLTFNAAVFATHAGDGSDRLFVVEQSGIIKVFPNQAAVDNASVFLDISRLVSYQGEEGLLGLAFDPDYRNSGTFYVHYSALRPRRSVIARYQVSATDANVADPLSEQLVLQVPQPFPNHNGGSIAFGPDGYLYIGLGDGGAAGDPLGHGQNTATLLGSILRIDPRSATPYAIPPDNPFVGLGATHREEIWAYGLRNPYRFSFDRLTGELWVGDVGQDAWEEIDIIVKGGNYGWNLYEADSTYFGGSPDGLQFPVFAYSHAVGQSITGGHVYRGSLTALQDHYLYADFMASGQIWALRLDHTTGQVLYNEKIPMPEVNVSAFGENEAGESLIVGYGGPLFRLTQGVGGGTEQLPQLLSQTGIFYATPQKPLADLLPTPGVEFYAVNSPLWSDYTRKKRWIALPGETSSISFDANQPWLFPVGTVLVKHFEIALQEGDEQSIRKLETRVMVKQQQGWRTLTYKWRTDGSDAELLLAEQTEVIAVTQRDGSVRTQNYLYPGPTACSACHNTAVKVLGVNTAQLNRWMDNGAYNQLERFSRLKYFTQPLGEITQYPQWVDLDTTSVSIEQRARSYLASNCAHCHQPAMPSPVNIDLRFDTALVSTNTVAVAPLAGDLGVAGARIITAGSKENSVLWLRMNSVAVHRMPSVASSEIHHQAVSLIGQWIDGLAASSALSN